MNENIFKYKDVKVKDLKKDYEKEFTPSQEYLDSMPDLQNSEFEGRYIDFVGITNFRVPILIRQRDGGTQQVLASIHGLCDVDSSKLGLNLSRIVRSFYKSKDLQADGYYTTCLFYYLTIPLENVISSFLLINYPITKGDY